MVKNAGPTFPAILASFDSIGCNFDIASILIFESNSADNTPENLRLWLDKHLECHRLGQVTHRRLLKPAADPATEFRGAHFARTDRYQAWRNYLLAEAGLEQERLAADLQGGFEYFVVFDELYFVEWKSILANGFRFKESGLDVHCCSGQHTPGIVWDEMALVLENGTWAFQPGVHGRWTPLVNSVPFLEVQSCFGGVLVVKDLPKLLDTRCRYVDSQAAITKDPLLEKYLRRTSGAVELCEHIPYNFCLRRSGLRIGTARDAIAHYNKPYPQYLPYFT
eukprot:gene1009-1550_t